MKSPAPIATAPTTPEDTIIVKLHPNHAQTQAGKDLAANAQLQRKSQSELIASLLRKVLGPAFIVKAA